MLGKGKGGSVCGRIIVGGSEGGERRNIWWERRKGREIEVGLVGIREREIRGFILVGFLFFWFVSLEFGLGFRFC